jgi:ankyrin repeat protein
MSTLSDMPMEILFEIADHLDYRGVNALARTSRQLYSSLNVKHLYLHDVTRSPSRSLIWAAENGLEGTLQRAVDASRDLNPIPESFHIALQVAADRGHVRLVELLLELDDINPNGLQTAPLLATPLIAACSKGHVEVINLLLAKDGIDVNLHNDLDKNTPLMIAVENRLVDVVESLLARNDLDPNIVNSDGNHVLGYSAYRGHADTVKLLLGRPDINPNFVGRHASTALICAVDDIIFHNPEVVKLLLDQKGIDVNKQKNSGATALCLAAWGRHVKAAKFLLDREDIDVNLPSRNGGTPLIWACYVECPDIVDLLLKKDDIDPNVRDNYGCTALTYASSLCRNIDNVRLLLSHLHINPNAVDNDGFSIYDKALDYSNHYHDEIMVLLRTAGASPTNCQLIHSYYPFKLC